uniref:Uncharacterized protein n=1 Tax=Anguilla anguilla TaxID=7936 RepID=A0A0E9TMA7_ANGAN
MDSLFVHVLQFRDIRHILWSPLSYEKLKKYEKFVALVFFCFCLELPFRASWFIVVRARNLH